MSRVTKLLIAVSAAIALSCALPLLLQAQTFTGLGALDDITTAGQTAGKKLVNLAFIFIGLVGAVALIPAAIKLFKGEPQSKDALTMVGLGLVAAFVILGIIKIVFNF